MTASSRCMSQQFGTALTREQAMALGIDQQVLAQLVSGAVLDEQARKLGLGVSKDRIAQLARDEPAFKGPDGQVRPAAVRAGAAAGRHDARGLSEQHASKSPSASRSSRRFRTGCMRPTLSSRRLRFTAAKTAPSTMSPSRDRWSSRSRSPATSILNDMVRRAQGDLRRARIPQDRLHQARPGSHCRPVAISDEQVQEGLRRRTPTATRRRRRARSSSSSSRRRKPPRPRSSRIADRRDLRRPGQGRRARRMADVQLGSFAKAQVPDPAIADAAFKLQANEVSQPVTGSFGTGAAPRHRDQAGSGQAADRSGSAESARIWPLAEATRILLDAHDSYEDARAGGATLAEAAAKLNLKVVTVDAIDRQALRPDGTVDRRPAGIAGTPQAGLRDGGRHRERGDQYRLDRLRLLRGTGHHACPRPHAGRGARQGRCRLEIGRGGEAARRQGDRARQAGQGWRRARYRGGAISSSRSRPSAASSAKPTTPISARTASRRCSASPKAAAAWCRTPGGDGRIIFKVAEVFEPAGAGPDAVPEDARKSFARGLSDDLLDQLVARLQAEYGVTVDQNAIQQALAF